MASDNLQIPDVQANQNAKEVTMNQAINLLDKAINNLVSVAITGNTVLTTTQARENAVIVLTGTPGVAFTLDMPDTNARLVKLANNTDSEVTVRNSAGGGTGQPAITPGSGSIFAYDGTNFQEVSSGGGGAGVSDDGVSILTLATLLNFTGGGVTVTDAGGGQANIAIPGVDAPGVGASSRFGILRYEVAATGDGGTAATATWTVRPLNTEATNEITGFGLASNQFTLPVGKYRIRAGGQFYRTNRAQHRLQNVTDATTALTGQAVYSNDSANGDAVDGVLEGVITIAGATKTFELQYIAESAGGGTEGLGVNAASGTGVFAYVIVERLSDEGLGITITETGTAVNLANTNQYQYQRYTATGAKTLTVQPNATEAIDQDAEFYLANRAASGNLTLVEGSGVTINVPTSGGLILEPGMAATLKRVASDTYDLIGHTTA